MEVAEKKQPHTVIRKTLARVLPYIKEGSENMGLSKYSMVLFEGGKYEEQLTCLEDQGYKRWVTGLDEFAPEVQKIEDEVKRSAVIKTIRARVSYLESMLAANKLDTKDPQFWDKVKRVRPDNHDFWKKYSLSMTNEPLFLDEKDANSLILIAAIEAGGFSSVAPSYEAARIAARPPKWYLDKGSDTAASLNEIKKLKNKARANLERLHESEPRKLFFIVKNVDSNSYRYINSTSSEVIYTFLDDYIDGKGSENAKRAALKFNELAETSIQDLSMKALIIDGAFYKHIVHKSDGMYWHVQSNTMLRRTPEEMLEFFKEPLNTDLYAKLQKEVETHWKS